MNPTKFIFATILLILSLNEKHLFAEESVWDLARKGDLTQLKTSINRANINAQDSSGETPLILAAIHQNAEAVKFLLSSGADATIKDSKGFTAIDAVESLIQRSGKNRKKAEDAMKKQGLPEHFIQNTLRTGNSFKFDEADQRKWEEIKKLLSEKLPPPTAVQPVTHCRKKSACEKLNCAQFNNPIKSGYTPDCVQSPAGNICRCMCHGCD